MKIKFIILFIVIQSLMIIIVDKIGINKTNALLINKTIEMNREYTSIQNYFDKIAYTVYEGYINRESNIEAFKQRDRKKLYGLLEEDYLNIKHIDFLQLHFHLPDNSSFLRMHEPDMYGDSLIGFRDSVEYVNKNKKPISGLEIGKVAPGFRYVYPLFSKSSTSTSDKEKNYIGSVENSLSVMAFINQLESLYKVHTHFLIHKDLLDERVDIPKKLYMEAVENKNFYKFHTENCNVGDIKRKEKDDLFSGIYKDIVSRNIKTTRPFSIEFNINDTAKIVTFLPIKNIKKKHIGYFVLYYKDDGLITIKNEIKKRYIVFGAIISLIFIILYKIVSQKKILSLEVKKQTKKYHGASKELGLKSQELNRLNRSLKTKVSEEVEKNRQKEFEIMEASKMVQMGEMIGNIAHQWRQPLSVISTISTGIIAKKEFGILDDNDLINDMEKINNSSQYLSETIETFRNFIKEEKVFKEQILQDNIASAVGIVSTVLKDVDINLLEDIDYENDIVVNMVSGELPQVIINIINNAKDILLEKELDERWVKISLEKIDNDAIITIEDNGGGIPLDVLPHIFDPYFTTKHQSVGTGLGLHMSKRIVVESLKGKLYVKNSENGAKFYIELPL